MTEPIAGKYRIVGELGRGAMGTVHRAIDETLGREVAIKVLNPEFTESRFMQRFQTEATTLARLNHPGIATLYELVRSGNDLLMVMEFVRGETLDKIIDRSGPLAPERAAHVIDKVLAALAYAHRAGIVHCDIKPANVMVTQHGGVKVMDFGVARVRGAAHGTVDGYLAGTPAYVAPEVVLAQSVDSRADLYSVGVLFFRLLTGVLPFKADTATRMVQKQILESPAAASEYRADLPEWCDAILQRALAKSPDERFQTAEEFRAALARANAILRTELTQGLSDLAQLELTLPSVAASAAVLPVARTPVPAEAINATQHIERATIVLQRKPHASPWSIAAFVVAILALAASVVLRLAPPAPVPATVSAAPVPSAALATAPPPAAPELKLGPTDQITDQMAASSRGSVGSDVGPSFSSGVSAADPGLAGTSRPQRDAGDSRAAVAASPSRPRPQPPAAALSRRGVASQPPGAAAVRPSSAGGSEPATPAPPANAAAATSALTTVPLVFEAKALVHQEGERKMRDAKVVLAEGKISVRASDDNRVLYSIPYENVLSISYSQGRDPHWNTATGPTRVARADGGVLGVFRVTRYWLSVRATGRRVNDQFVSLLFPAELRAKYALRALEERTGRRAEIVRKGDED